MATALPAGLNPVNMQISRGRMKSVKLTEVEVGAPRLRHQYRSTPFFMDISWTMTKDEFELFDVWFIDTLDDILEFDLNIDGIHYNARFFGEQPWTLEVDQTANVFIVSASVVATAA